MTFKQNQTRSRHRSICILEGIGIILYNWYGMNRSSGVVLLQPRSNFTTKFSTPSRIRKAFRDILLSETGKFVLRFLFEWAGKEEMRNVLEGLIRMQYPFCEGFRWLWDNYSTPSRQPTCIRMENKPIMFRLLLWVFHGSDFQHELFWFSG